MRLARCPGRHFIVYKISTLLRYTNVESDLVGPRRELVVKNFIYIVRAFPHT